MQSLQVFLIFLIHLNLLSSPTDDDQKMHNKETRLKKQEERKLEKDDLEVFPYRFPNNPEILLLEGSIRIPLIQNRIQTQEFILHLDNGSFYLTLPGADKSQKLTRKETRISDKADDTQHKKLTEPLVRGFSSLIILGYHQSNRKGNQKIFERRVPKERFQRNRTIDDPSSRTANYRRFI